MKKVEIDKETLEKYIKSGKLKNQVCDELHISIGTLRRLVQEHGLVFPVRSWRKDKSFVHHYTHVDENWLTEHWLNTDKSLKQLSEEFSVPVGVLESRRVMFGMKKRYKYPINTKKLFDDQDPNVYYLAGLIATDGYLPKGQNAVEINLTGESERELLVEIKQYFECAAPIESHGSGYRLRMVADGLNDFLKNTFNIPDGAKTFNVGVPTHFPSELCARAYVHGCIDGDGWIAKNGKNVAFVTASKELVSGMCNIITTYTSIRIPWRYTSRAKASYPSFTLDCKKCRSFLEWLYSDNPYIFLKRKRPG